MTQPLATSVRGSYGQPATVRIGKIISINPMVLSIQGALYTGAAVGLLEGYVPVVDDTVSVIGQSITQGPDPSSWLVLGKIIPSDTIQAGDLWLDGANVGAVTLASAVTAETDLSQLALSFDAVTGGAYLIHVQFQYAFTVATDDFRVRVRSGTPVVGTEVAQAQFSSADLLNPLYVAFPFYPSGPGTFDLFFSVERVAGTGTITVSGSPGGGNSRTWSGVQAVGKTDGFGGVWRSTT